MVLNLMVNEDESIVTADDTLMDLDTAIMDMGDSVNSFQISKDVNVNSRKQSKLSSNDEMTDDEDGNTNKVRLVTYQPGTVNKKVCTFFSQSTIHKELLELHGIL